MFNSEKRFSLKQFTKFRKVYPKSLKQQNGPPGGARPGPVRGPFYFKPRADPGVLFRILICF